MKSLFTLLIIFSGKIIFSQNILAIDDLKNFEGSWTGELSYLDYSSNSITKIPVNVKIKNSGDQVMLDYVYPDEPNANSSEIITIKRNGTYLGKEKIISVIRNENGIKFITERKGSDNGERAMYKFTYTCSSSTLELKKEVKLNSADNWFIRSTYLLQK